jgi:hypothetical protein
MFRMILAVHSDNFHIDHIVFIPRDVVFPVRYELIVIYYLHEYHASVFSGYSSASQKMRIWYTNSHVALHTSRAAIPF